MKEKLLPLIHQALSKLQAEQVIAADISIDNIIINACKDKSHGDYATNCALMLAKKAGLNPRELAEKIKNALAADAIIQKVEIAGPGFINFFLSENTVFDIITTALNQADQFGRNDMGHGKRVHIEYVSANPTGPLHVGHGRGAAYGSSTANLLAASGFQVHREYYVNDAGRQMQILALSVWFRYLQLHEEQVFIPAKAYQGEYIIDIAKHLIETHQSRFHHTPESIDPEIEKTNIDAEENPEAYLDAMILVAKKILGETDFAIIFNTALESILADICEDLAEFHVDYDEWFHESKLFKDGMLDASIKLLDDHGYTYKKEGATWFRATEFGDEKDRVLIRSNGITTYFASDVAYHLYKYRQGYDTIIDVFGADHHGYIARLQAFLKGLGENPEQVRILLVQFAILYRGDSKVPMSTRSGQFVSLRELRAEVGNDAARFFYLMRKPEQHLDFDLELAKSRSNENPVYYIQYAHARICSVWRSLPDDQAWDQKLGLSYVSLLTNSYEKALMDSIRNYPDIVKSAAEHYEPHRIAHFLLNLANQFHSYYNAEKFIVEQTALRNARLCLVKAIQHVFVNGLDLLGISAPNKM